MYLPQARLRSLRVRLEVILGEHPGLLEDVKAALAAHSLDLSPVAKPPQRLPRKIALAVVKCVLRGAGKRVPEYFGRSHGYKIMAIDLARDLASTDVVSELPAAARSDDVTRQRSLNLAVADVLRAIAHDARKLPPVEGAVLELHNCSDAPLGRKKGLKGAGIFADEAGMRIVCEAARRVGECEDWFAKT